MALEMDVPLSWRHLTHDRRRLLVSVAGITLAIVLMFMQLGFLNAMFDSQVEFARYLNADLVLVGKLKYLTNVSETFTRRRLFQVRSDADVAGAYPIYLENNLAVWKNPQDRSVQPIRVLAFDPRDPVLEMPAVRDHAAELQMPNTVLFDVRSRSTFGDIAPGTETELARRRVRVVGTFELGTDFIVDGTVIMSDKNFLKFFPEHGTRAPQLRRVDLGVIKLTPGADCRAVQARLKALLPNDVNVLTKDEYMAMEVAFWRANTAIGFVFTLGVLVGFAVGVVICYQILYTNVTHHLPQFATLKAMGYPGRYLVGVVLQEAAILALLSFGPGLLLSWTLYVLIGRLTGLVFFFSVARVAMVLTMSMGMCLLSGLMAIRKVMSADPAEVF